MADSATKENMMPKRSRIKYKPEQVDALEKAFEVNHYPDTLQQEQLALELNVTLDRVSIWFQNRRSKFKRQRQTDHMAWMRKQIFQNRDDTDGKGLLGTPKLPLPTSACHVLSPVETQVPRDDTAAETLSCSPSPRAWTSAKEARYDVYNHYPSNTSGFKPIPLSTPTKPLPDYSMAPVTTLQEAHPPFYDIFQSFSPAFTSVCVPSMHSVAHSHVARSRLHYVEPNGCQLPQQQPLTSNIQINVKHENYYSCYSNKSVTSDASSKQTFGWLDSDSDSSPSKDKALECLAQWC